MGYAADQLPYGLLMDRRTSPSPFTAATGAVRLGSEARARQAGTAVTLPGTERQMSDNA